MIRAYFELGRFSFGLRFIPSGCFLCPSLGGGIKPDNIGLVTSTGEQKSSESTKPFMAVYLKTLNGENIVTDPSLRKRRRRRRQQQLPETTTANPFQSTIVYLYVGS